ncbi:MAG: SH3 domain-containing protein [Anaerolineae bacterium]|nr:SH3 domain-containing protein [Anaerolineae bacterium]
MNFSRTGVLALLLALLLTPAAALSQEDGRLTCPGIVESALGVINQACQQTGDNQACYGHILIQANPPPGIESLVFDQEGDIADLTEVRSLRLSPMDVEAGLWGVSLMRLQTNLAAVARSESVTFIAFGDVEMTDASKASALLNVKISATEAVNVRRTPSVDAFILGTVQPGQTLIATGRLADGTWLRVVLPGAGETGWVYRPLVTDTGDIETLDVVEPDELYYTPFQAFYFRSGAGDAACLQAPESGLLIQTPEGVGEVRFLINEVSIQFSAATAFLQAAPGGALTLSLLDGAADVQAFGATQSVYPGTQVSIPLGGSLSPAGLPQPPRPYDKGTLDKLPTDVLGKPVAVLLPLTEDEILKMQTALPADLTKLPIADGSQTLPGYGAASQGSDATTQQDDTALIWSIYGCPQDDDTGAPAPGDDHGSLPASPSGDGAGSPPASPSGDDHGSPPGQEKPKPDKGKPDHPPGWDDNPGLDNDIPPGLQ